MIDWEKLCNSKYSFMDREYTHEDIKNFKRVKIYTESSHFDRVLVRDEVNNRLFLYEFYERFMADDMYTTWVLVENEADADELNKEKYIVRKNAFRFDDNMKFIVY